MYEASCYSSENENKLKEICFIKKCLHLKKRGRGGLLERDRERERGGGLNRENTVQTQVKIVFQPEVIKVKLCMYD